MKPLSIVWKRLVSEGATWIGGRPMEDWLGARPGSSPCCEVCGDLPCRTVEVDGTTYEAIPEDFIVRAGVIAAAKMIGSETSATNILTARLAHGAGHRADESADREGRRGA